MFTELHEAIARLRRVRPFDLDAMLICDALEAYLNRAPKFDKTTYMREYMRKRRAAKT